MRRPLAAAALAIAFAAPGLAAGPAVRLVDFEGPITGPSIQRIVQAAADADREGDALVLVRLDTPGGLVDATEEGVKAILGAKTPVAVWVGPSGARAASGGFFLLMAADVAAMAPGTRTGAASVVSLFGEDRDDDPARRKAQSDLAAGLRAVVERRGRNVAAAERAVAEAVSFTEEEAVRERLVDHVASSPEDLLARLDGATVRRFDGTETVLRTAGFRFVTSSFGWSQRFLEFLGTPMVAGLLLLLGLGGIYLEMTHPGLILPGAVGVACLVLFAMSSRILPISAVGVLLVLTGVVLFALELKIVSHGLLGLAGTGCLLAGALMLVEGPIPELRLPLAFVLPSVVVAALILAGAVRLALAAQRAPVATGPEGLCGEVGMVRRALAPEGTVYVHGELWSAVSEGAPVPEGTPVRILRVEALRLVVEPAEGVHHAV